LTARPKNRAQRRAARASAESGTSGALDRASVLKFIADNPDQAGKREIARAFGLKGAARIDLKNLLRELEEEGVLEKRRRRLVAPGTMPHVAVLDIVSRDADGALIAVPSEWDGEHGIDPPRIRLATVRERVVKPAGIGNRVLARTFPAEAGDGVDYTARVMKVFEKTRIRALGVLRRAGDGTFRIDPVDRKQPELIVGPNDLGTAKPGDLVEIEPTRQRGFGPPSGRIVAVVGSMASEQAVSAIAIHAHAIPHVFPDVALREAEAARPAPMADREDWRTIPLVTIDPADAKDHDDAVHAEADPDQAANPGGYIVRVAIADVAFYVRPGSALDREAVKRGNSVYFPDRVVPMLPERISNDLCSLREKEDRPALAVAMTIDRNGRKLGHRFHRVMMRSHARLAYPQAQAAIDGKPEDRTAPILDTVLKPLWAAYRLLKKARDKREPLDLDLPERKILLTPDGQVDKVVIPPRLDAHRLIEEMMILANVAAAETLEERRQALLYRIHDAPSLAKQESLREFLRTIDISLARGAQLKPSMFNKILAQVREADHETLVNEVVLRSQSQAEYDPRNIGHFGLNLRRYAHFTSPIRRYADLVVHRALIGSLGFGDDGLTRQEEARLAETAALISAAERRAMAAERDTVDRLVAHHLAERVGESFDGRITGVNRAGLFVNLPGYGADGFVPASQLGQEYFRHDEARHALVGDQSGRGYQLGDRVRVELAHVQPLAGAMRFGMESEPKPLAGSNQSFHKRGGRCPGTAQRRRRR
jgi:ribonuclease R